MKRVYCLYRVSTTAQVEHDDIPMQKEACRKFVSHNPDWEITREYLEKGVSGYKISAEQRDAIQKIRDAAQKGELDILLVYMFDRLGRRDDETPFLVEWFVRHNIEVWSAMEGQQRFDSHIDKLLNYIRFWQASGESQKLSMRITTKLAQMAEEGVYRGGFTPYGYKLEKLGRTNRKGHDVHDMVVAAEEAEVIRLLFQKVGIEGYSSGAAANYLNEVGIPTKGLALYWRASSIRSIMKNPIYTGRIKHSGRINGPFEKYRIVSDALFAQVQGNLENHKTIEKPFFTETCALLTGLLACGTCGESLAANRYQDKRKGKGTEVLRTYYRCYSRISCKTLCAGQSAYSMKRVDTAVQNAVSLLISQLDDKYISKIRSKIRDTMYRVYGEQKEVLNKALVAARREEKLLQNALVDALIGKNSLASEIINDRLESQSWKIKKINSELEMIEKEFRTDYDKVSVFMRPQHVGSEIFTRTDMLTKRKILELLISRITISDGYKIVIHFKCSMKGIEGIFTSEMEKTS